MTDKIFACSVQGCGRTADTTVANAADNWLIAPVVKCPEHAGTLDDDCPACNGSGKIDPNTVLGGRAAGGGICPVCKGNGKVQIKARPSKTGKLMEFAR